MAKNEFEKFGDPDTLTIGELFSAVYKQTDYLLFELQNRMPEDVVASGNDNVPGTELKISFTTLPSSMNDESDMNCSEGTYENLTLGVSYPRTSLFSVWQFVPDDEIHPTPVTVIGYRNKERHGDFEIGRHRASGLIVARLGNAGLAETTNERNLQSSFYPKIIVAELSEQNQAHIAAVLSGISDNIEAAEMICYGEPSYEVLSLLGKDSK